MAERVIDVNIAEQSRQDLQDYAIYVARNRAIPEMVDGLKPVIRRILWCAANDFRGQGFIKTSNIMGQVIRKYNPHGDASVQMAIRNMINDFSTKYPTMEGSGSWGSKANPNPAAPRYTECKISKFAVDVFARDIYEDKNSTDWVENYDKRAEEPLYLPARVPALLVLGQVGIAVGIKSSIPSHNLGEVIDTTIALMKDPKHKFCLIPDECMSCELLDTDWKKINETGNGTYVAQGIIETGEYQGHPALFIKSLPDFTYFDSVKDSIIKLVESGKMPYIQDHVSRTKTVMVKGERITNFDEVITLKKGTDPNFVKEYLYANTAIRQTRQVRLIVIKDNKLCTMNYRDYLLDFINFRRMTVTRRLNSLLQKYKTSIHERRFLLYVLSKKKELDSIIDMIRKQKTTDNQVLIDFMANKLKITNLQAKYLLETGLNKLTEGYRLKYEAELKELEANVARIMDILLHKDKIDGLIIQEMLEIKNKYNTKRMCRIISKSEASGIAPGTFKLVFTKNNFIKKIGENEEVGSLNRDEVNFVIKVENDEDVMVFSSLGKVFKMPVHKIPIAAKGSNGVDIRVLNKYATSNIACAVSESTVKKLVDSKYHNYLFVVSRRGFIKKIDISDILTAPPSGIIYSKLDEGDYVQDILFGPDKMDLLIYSGTKVLRINSKEVPYLKRSTKGNRASTASSLIDGMNFVLPKATSLIVVTKDGYVNKLSLDIIPRSNRGKAGTKVIKLKKDDSILNIWPCTEDDVLVSYQGRKNETIQVSSIKEGSTISSGERLLKSPTRVVLTHA